MSSEQANFEDNQDPQSQAREELSTDAEPISDAAAEAIDGAEDIQQELDKAQATIKDYYDQMMRLRAEIENNRKRAERDVENAHKYALKTFLENLLPIIDSMEMGQQAATAGNASLESIREGMDMTMNMFVQVLEKQGLEQINPIGDAFDPERHQAISMLENTEADANTVVEVMQKGFALNDRLVRPAMVVVAK